MIDLAIELQMLSDWHIGTGDGRHGALDSLVDRDSDVDVVIPHVVAPGIVVYMLEKAGYKLYHIEIIQATPSYTPKVYIYLDPGEELIVSFPLARLGEREREFYKWGGELDLDGVRRGLRVPGVNKDLKLIIPTSNGHKELEVEGNESYVARVLGISIETVMERVRVLKRRRIHGRTGVFIKEPIPPGASIEEVVDRLIREVPAFRRRLQGV